MLSDGALTTPHKPSTWSYSSSSETREYMSFLRCHTFFPSYMLPTLQPASLPTYHPSPCPSTLLGKAFPHTSRGRGLLVSHGDSRNTLAALGASETVGGDSQGPHDLPDKAVELHSVGPSGQSPAGKISQDMGKQPKRPRVGEWMKKLWCIHAVGCS